MYPKQSGKQKGPKQLNPEINDLLKKHQKQSLSLTKEEIQNRMIARLINEAVFCLQDKIIASPIDGDIGFVFGIGFPPFLGGPFRYIDAMGVSKFRDMLLAFADKYGPQFKPAPLLDEYAKSGRKFYP